MFHRKGAKGAESMIEWTDASILPPHKEDLIIKVIGEFSKDEIYITGGYFDRDCNEWNIFGFERDLDYHALSYFVIPKNWF